MKAILLQDVILHHLVDSILDLGMQLHLFYVLIISTIAETLELSVFELDLNLIPLVVESVKDSDDFPGQLFDGRAGINFVYSNNIHSSIYTQPT